VIARFGLAVTVETLVVRAAIPGAFTDEAAVGDPVVCAHPASSSNTTTKAAVVTCLDTPPPPAAYDRAA